MQTHMHLQMPMPMPMPMPTQMQISTQMQTQVQPQMPTQVQARLMQPLTRPPPPTYTLTATISQPLRSPVPQGQRQDPAHDVAPTLLPMTTIGQNRAAQPSMDDPGPSSGLSAESTDLLGLALLPPQSSTQTGSDICQAKERLTDATTLAGYVATDHAPRSSETAAAAAAAAAGGKMLPLAATGRKKVVYVDLPSRSVFTRSVLH
eukprot:COSAG02_NODE_1016_length_15190_cov_128.667418_9_plen_205_part_00